MSSNCEECDKRKKKQEESKRKREAEKNAPQTDKAVKKAKAIADKFPKDISAMQKLAQDFPENTDIQGHCTRMLTSIISGEDEIAKTVEGSGQGCGQVVKQTLAFLNERTDQLCKTLKEKRTDELSQISDEHVMQEIAKLKASIVTVSDICGSVE